VRDADAGRGGGLSPRQATAGVLLGWARSALGDPAAGCHDLETALAAYRRTGAASELPYFLIFVGGRGPHGRVD
jgi:hypothetical protein